MTSNHPFKIHWLDLTDIGFNENVLGIASHLPGARHRLISRSLQADVGEIHKHRIKHAYVFCEENELMRFGVPLNQLSEALKHGSIPSRGRNAHNPDNDSNATRRDHEVEEVSQFNAVEEDIQSHVIVHHFPVTYGCFPSMKDLLKIINDILSYIQNNEKVIFISRDGFGRSSTVAACLLLHTHDEMDSYTPDVVYNIMKTLMRSSRAIQTVRQYNTMVDFRLLRDDYLAGVDEGSFSEAASEDVSNPLPTHRWGSRERNLSR